MYCTKQDLIDRFSEEEIESIAWDAETDAIDDTKIDRACSDAAAQVDLYVAGKITTPSEAPPAMVVSIACDIARYQLQSERPLDEVKARYEDAMRILRDIAQGKASLGETGESSTPARVETLRGDSDRVFTKESLEGF